MDWHLVGLGLGVAFIGYTYLGYGVLMAGLARLVGRAPSHTSRLPRVSLIIAACDEAAILEGKLQNTLALDYPADLLEVIVAADGSRDGTVAVAERFRAAGVRVLHEPARRGKNHAVNRAVACASGEIVVLSDANAFYREDALRMLVRNFGDERVALVAGAKRVVGEGQAAAEAEGLYWRYESWLKVADSRVSSVLGAAGEILAVRRSAWLPPPEGVVIEDFWLTLALLRQGHRAVYEPEAVATELGAPAMADEWERRVRISAGGWQALVDHRELLSPRWGLLAFQLWSHRVARWVVVPPLLPLLAWLTWTSQPAPVARLLGGLELAAVALAAVGWALERLGLSARSTTLPYWLLMTNAAALAGAWRFWTRQQPAAWARVRRTAGVPATTPCPQRRPR
ncbi:MAG: glycosyltransferase family 2 protein [Candidatus Sericytochromatia bacterium]|nr:glycosyltransferase family 2 protein [Candidatus Sericytochromatia bacterium]